MSLNKSIQQENMNQSKLQQNAQFEQLFNEQRQKLQQVLQENTELI